MPQMNKGGKFIFGKSLIHNDGTIQIPAQAIKEYCIVDEGKVYVGVNAEHIASRSININAVALWIVFCKYCYHCIESPYHSINHQLQKLEAFQSVHHVIFILCYNVLSDFSWSPLPLRSAQSRGPLDLLCPCIFPYQSS